MEKREFERFGERIPIYCSLFNADRVCEGEMVDFSENGICFSCSRVFDTVFKEGRVVLIRLNGAAKSLPAAQGRDLRSISIGRIIWREEALEAHDSRMKVGVKLY